MLLPNASRPVSLSTAFELITRGVQLQRRSEPSMRVQDLIGVNGPPFVETAASKDANGPSACQRTSDARPTTSAAAAPGDSTRRFRGEASTRTVTVAALSAGFGSKSSGPTVA